MSKIIKENDPRYPLLEEVFRKWNWDNFRRKVTSRYRYIIPKELVIGGCTEDEFMFPLKTNSEKYCNLTLQEYFDLIVLHINNTDDRPKCPNCNKEILFSGELARGYARHEWNSSTNNFCSAKCRQTYIHSNLDEYPHEVERRLRWVDKICNDYERQAKASMSRFLIRGSLDDLVIFYTGLYRNELWIKYGITEDFKNRNHHKELKTYRLIHLPRYKACLLEYLIKMEVKDNNIEGEYLDISLESYLNNLLADKLTLISSKSKEELLSMIEQIRD